jgi:hypothetical protein
MSRKTFLRFFRLTHLYFGVFITPALLFFAFTGAMQTFGLHETNRDHPNYKPAHWIVVLGQLHKKQTTIIPVRRLQPPATPSTAVAGDESSMHPNHRHEASESATSSAPSETSKPGTSGSPLPPAVTPARHPLPLRIFFLVVSVGLFHSTLTGLFMSYSYIRNKLLITGLLIAGVILPLILIFV